MRRANMIAWRPAILFVVSVLIGMYPLGFAAAIDDVVELSLTGIDPVFTGATAGGGFEQGWKWTFHFTVPTSETELTLLFSDFTDGSNRVPASNIRFYSAQSSAASTADSAITITAANASSTAMVLDGDASADAAGRQVDGTVEMQVPEGTPGGAYAGTDSAEADVPPPPPPPPDPD